MRYGKRILLVSAVVLAIVVALLAAAPFLVERYVNHTLAGLENYAGRVESIDLAIRRGNYSLERLRIDMLDAGIPQPFVSVNRMDISVQWGALIRGALVAEVHALEPRMVFVDAESERQSQNGLGPAWADKLKPLAPYRFNKVTVRDGRLEFRKAPTAMTMRGKAKKGAGPRTARTATTRPSKRSATGGHSAAAGAVHSFSSQARCC